MSEQTAAPYAEPANLTKAQIFSLAESIAGKLGFKPGDDLHELIKTIGGSIEVRDTLTEDPEKSGSLYVSSPNKFKIIVPTHTSLSRDRFTIAHELGHFVVHYLWRRKNGSFTGDSMVALRKGSDRVEWEANWFAASFLMPKGAFEDAYAEFGGNVSSVAAKFEVSSSAALVRASQLGLG